MINWITPAGSVRMRRGLYLLLLAAGTAGVFGVLLSDAGVGATHRSAPAAVETASRLPTRGEPLTSGTHMDGFGSWAPDGKSLLFMRSGQIWHLDAASKKARLLVNSEGNWDAVPAWRRDGKEIAFVRASAAGDRASLLTADPKSGTTNELLIVREPVGQIAWAPSGKGLYYTTPRRLMYIEVGAKEPRTIWTAQDGWEMLAGGLSVSPDAAIVIFGAGPETNKGTSYDLWTVSTTAGDGRAQRLTTGGGIMPAVDTGGKRLLYRNPRADTGIYLMDLTTHQTRQVIADDAKGMHFHPGFSPDGRSLVVSRLAIDAPPSKNQRTPFTSHLYLHTLGGAGEH